LAGGLLAFYWRPSRPLLAGTLAMGLWLWPLLLLAAAAPIGLIVLGSAAAGASLAVFAALWQTVLQTRVPSDLRSRPRSSDLPGFSAPLRVGFRLGGLVGSTVGAAPGLIAAAAILACGTIAVAATPCVRAVCLGDGSEDADLLDDFYGPFTPRGENGATLLST